MSDPNDEPTVDVVRYEVRDQVAVITLARPAARNAINGAVATALEAAIDRIEDDPAVRVAILTADTTGQGRPVFCAGADLKAIAAGEAAALSTDRGGFAGFVYRDRDTPVIAAVDGLATAGGCELVLAADLIVASTRSAFGLAEAKRNLIAGAGGLFRLPRALGRSTAMEMVLTGEPIDAERAFQLGLVSRLTEPGAALDEALALAERIVACGPIAVRESRRIVLAAQTSTDDELRRMTADASRRVFASDDLQEGLRAFVERRQPRWTGR